jgi:hypothetical protein
VPAHKPWARDTDKSKAHRGAQGQHARLTNKLIIGLFFSKLTFLTKYFDQNCH